MEAEKKNRRIKKNLNIYKSAREDMKPFRGVLRPREHYWMVQIFESTTKATDRSEEDRTKPNFKKLKTIRTTKDVEIQKTAETGTSTKKRQNQTFTVPSTELH